MTVRAQRRRAGRAKTLTEHQFADLLAFRIQLRRFGRWSAAQAKAVGLTHAQHQLVLAVRAHCTYAGSADPPTIGDLADYLLLRHHSVVELVDRAEAVGCVRRQHDERDARVARVVLTARGQELIEQLTELHLAELRQLAPALHQLVGGGR